MAALIFFFLVCLLIFKRRIIDKGLRAASLLGKAGAGVNYIRKRGVNAVIQQEDVNSVTAAPLKSISTASAAISIWTVTAASLQSTATVSTSSLNPISLSQVVSRTVLPSLLPNEATAASLIASADTEVADLVERLDLDHIKEPDETGETMRRGFSRKLVTADVDIQLHAKSLESADTYDDVDLPHLLTATATPINRGNEVKTKQLWQNVHVPFNELVRNEL